MQNSWGEAQLPGGLLKATGGNKMSKYLERAKQVRKIEDPHYNCCQD